LEERMIASVILSPLPETYVKLFFITPITISDHLKMSRTIVRKNLQQNEQQSPNYGSDAR
jgi:hypothetical protein